MLPDGNLSQFLLLLQKNQLKKTRPIDDDAQLLYHVFQLTKILGNNSLIFYTANFGHIYYQKKLKLRYSIYSSTLKMK